MDRLSVSPRLKLAMELGRSGSVAADIGCDHGKLGIVLLREKRFQRIIATDISFGSLSKCRELAGKTGLTGSFDYRCGDGLLPLRDSEADTVFILGLGGKQIWTILSADPSIRGAKVAVLSPMKDVETLRRELFLHSFRILEDRIAQEDRRLYQVFSVAPGKTTESLPARWPESCFEAGYRCFQMRDPLLPVLIQRRIASHRRSLSIASGTSGESKLNEKLSDLLAIQSLIGEDWRL